MSALALWVLQVLFMRRGALRRAVSSLPPALPDAKFAPAALPPVPCANAHDRTHPRTHRCKTCQLKKAQALGHNSVPTVVTLGERRAGRHCIHPRVNMCAGLRSKRLHKECAKAPL